jgi:hypothetical protein
MPKRPQITVSFNEMQIQHIASETGVEIEDATTLKQAIINRFPNMPEDKKAGAPPKKPYQRKKKQG